jgi:hypothetical protein
MLAAHPTVELWRVCFTSYLHSYWTRWYWAVSEDNKKMNVWVKVFALANDKRFCTVPVGLIEHTHREREKKQENQRERERERNTLI